MSDLAVANCPCDNGCDNGCGCECRNHYWEHGVDGCCTHKSGCGNNMLWIILLLCFCGNNGGGFLSGRSSCDCECGCGGRSGDNTCLIIILLLLCGNNNSCGCCY